MQTPTPIVQITGRKCTGFGEDRGNVWVVAGCDTLSRISQVTGISLEELQAANPAIRDPDLIFPNQHIRLPGR
jgi:LysM repeat protein